MSYFLQGRFWPRLALLFFASVSPAYAYLDPGSGSYILQLLLGGIAGLAVVTKLYWNHFLTFLGSLRTTSADSEKEGQNCGQGNKN